MYTMSHNHFKPQTSVLKWMQLKCQAFIRFSNAWYVYAFNLFSVKYPSFKPQLQLTYQGIDSSYLCSVCIFICLWFKFVLYDITFSKPQISMLHLQLTCQCIHSPYWCSACICVYLWFEFIPSIFTPQICMLHL